MKTRRTFAVAGIVALSLSAAVAASIPASISRSKTVSDEPTLDEVRIR